MSRDLSMITSSPWSMAWHDFLERRVLYRPRPERNVLCHRWNFVALLVNHLEVVRPSKVVQPVVDAGATGSQTSSRSAPGSLPRATSSSRTERFNASSVAIGQPLTSSIQKIP
jgi:hypothetical protein